MESFSETSTITSILFLYPNFESTIQVDNFDMQWVELIWYELDLSKTLGQSSSPEWTHVWNLIFLTLTIFFFFFLVSGEQNKILFLLPQTRVLKLIWNVQLGILVVEGTDLPRSGLNPTILLSQKLVGLVFRLDHRNTWEIVKRTIFPMIITICFHTNWKGFSLLQEKKGKYKMQQIKVQNWV